MTLRTRIGRWKRGYRPALTDAGLPSSPCTSPDRLLEWRRGNAARTGAPPHSRRRICCCWTSPPTISTAAAGRLRRSCSNVGRAASSSPATTCALRERVDRIVELMLILHRHIRRRVLLKRERGGGYRTRAADDLDRASDALRNTERASESLAGQRRRAAATAPGAPRGIETRLFMERHERAESRRRAAQKPARRPPARRPHRGAAKARAQVEILTPLSIDLPRTYVPCGRRTRRVEKCGDGFWGAPSVRNHRHFAFADPSGSPSRAR